LLLTGNSVIRGQRHVDPKFLLRDFEPAYLETYRRGEFPARVKAALAELEDCCACPRNCHVNRLVDKARVCNTGRHAIVSSAFAHFGEEDCLRGWNGSGTIFFGLCNLRCVFCQNWDISQQHTGAERNAEDIATLMLQLQDRGCHNINFVTPEHVAPQVAEAIAAAVPRGLKVPIVYNTSAYDSIQSLKLMDGLVDIYMPDFKFFSYEPSRSYLKAKDYPARACEAIREMHRQVGDLCFSDDGLARRGLLVRHLVMPNYVDESREISSTSWTSIVPSIRSERVANTTRLTAGRVATNWTGLTRLPGKPACGASTNAGS
jgi:putative pyruvate formate lyase activating enzyme